MAITKLAQLYDPEILANLVDIEIGKNAFGAITKMEPKSGAGSTITFPKWGYIGDAEDVLEAGELTPAQLTQTTRTATFKKIGKAVELTDEAQIHGLGDALGEAVRQIGQAINKKLDRDEYTALMADTVPTVDASSDTLTYQAIVEAKSLLDNERMEGKELYMFVSGAQESLLALMPEFKDKDTLVGDNCVMTGYIGKIAGIRVISSKLITASGGFYVNPICIGQPLTCYTKGVPTVEQDRDIKKGIDVLACFKHFVIDKTYPQDVVAIKCKEHAVAKVV